MMICRYNKKICSTAWIKTTIAFIWYDFSALYSFHRSNNKCNYPFLIQICMSVFHKNSKENGFDAQNEAIYLIIEKAKLSLTKTCL